MISDAKTSQSQVQLIYRYDWTKHSNDEVLEFCLNALPKQGWTLDHLQVEGA